VFATALSVAETLNNFEEKGVAVLNDDFTMTVQDTAGQPGDEDHLIPVTGTWNESFNRYFIKIEYDSTKIGVTDITFDGTVAEENFTIVEYNVLPGWFYVHATAQQSPVPPGNGLLMNIVVDIFEEAPPGPTYLNFTHSPPLYSAYYPNVLTWTDPMMPELHNGTLTITDNNPPETPDQPNGPTEGFVGEEYTYTTNPVTDPDGDDVQYLFDWGNGEDSGWVNEPTASYMWNDAGTYDVKVKARDIYEAESDWSDPLSVEISEVPDEPELIVHSITGGKGVTVVIKNIGNADATDIEWSISIDGGLFFWKPTESSDTVDAIAINESETITMEVGGIGLGILTEIPTITVSAECAEGPSTEHNETARIIFSSVKLLE